MKRHSTLPLPAHRHLPGSGGAADMVPLDAAKGDDANAFRYGADLFNHGYFWEAHEVWEAVWLASPPNSRRRQGVHSLIQMANACLKLAMGRCNAFRRLAAEVESLAPGPDLEVEGLDVAAACRQFSGFVAGVPDAGEAIERPERRAGFPVISLAHDQARNGAAR